MGYWSTLATCEVARHSDYSMQLEVSGNAGAPRLYAAVISEGVTREEAVAPESEINTYTKYRANASGKYIDRYDNSTSISVSTPSIYAGSDEWISKEVELTPGKGSFTGEIRIQKYTPTPPSTPSNITVNPSEVKEGENISISWGTGSGASKYHLERSVNGGSYTQIYSGSSRSHSDTALASWNTVAYRVRGYNSDGYSSYKTSDSITVEHNSAPPRPSSISLPSTLSPGVSFTVSWGSSIDPDGDSVTYILERSINGGSWSQIYSGISRSKSQTPTSSWDTVEYRVRASDGSLDSSYRISSTRTVTHNKAPSTPSSITVPELKSGKSATISWGSSSDSDGDSITYYLYRSVNGGSYSTIRSGGTSRSYVDTIDKSWNTVTYQVRAYDGKAYSGYKTSNTITVKHFPEFNMKVNGELKVSDNGWAKVNGELREIESIHIKINGIVKEVK